MAFQTMKSLLPQRLRQTGLERAVQAAQVIEAANRVLDTWFGRQTSERTAQAVSLRSRQLSVASLDAGIRHELRLREPDFIKAVNNTIGQPCVDCLRIVF